MYKYLISFQEHIYPWKKSLNRKEVTLDSPITDIKAIENYLAEEFRKERNSTRQYKVTIFSFSLLS